MKTLRGFLVGYIFLMGFASFWIYLTWTPGIFPFLLSVILTAILGAIMGIASWVFFTEIVIPERRSNKEKT